MRAAGIEAGVLSQSGRAEDEGSTILKVRVRERVAHAQ